MKKDLRDKWVAALRSGKYRQAKGQLKKDSRTMCCLGVLHDISGGHWNRPDDYKKTGLFGSQGTLNNRVLPMKIQDKLTDMNDGDDGKQYRFNEIADWIECNVPAK